jgi:UDP-GlcNAc:undecaprenyl-phosphate GlcNAc-1-phosphate transferase
MRQVLPTRRTREGRRVLIYGAGDGGELLLREILNNHNLHLAPIGFIDDDPRKTGKVIHGLKVWGGNGSLRQICLEQRAEEVLISSTRVSSERVAEIRRACEEERITLRRMRIELEQLSED